MSEEAKVVTTETPIAVETKEVAKEVTTETPVVEESKAPPVAEKVVEAPQEIKYDLKLSEGSKLNQARVDEILAEAKAGKLTNEQAQGLLQREEKAVSTYQKSLDAQVEANRGEWLKQLENDPKIGGAKWKENAETAHLFLKKHADPGMMAFLDKSALGNNPTVFKFILKLANMAKSDSFVNGGGSTHAGGNAEEARLARMYDKTN